MAAKLYCLLLLVAKQSNMFLPLVHEVTIFTNEQDISCLYATVDSSGLYRLSDADYCEDCRRSVFICSCCATFPQ
jgi:hypothetical protein